MPVLKDVECAKCGTVREVFCDPSEESVEAYCDTCDDGKPHLHRSVCNGGCGRRWRFNDPPPDPTGYIQSGGVACGRPQKEAIDTPEESKYFTPDRTKSGITHEGERFSDRVREDRRKERRDRQRSADGHGPLFFNA